MHCLKQLLLPYEKEKIQYWSPAGNKKKPLIYGNFQLHMLNIDMKNKMSCGWKHEKTLGFLCLFIFLLSVHKASPFAVIMILKKSSAGSLNPKLLSQNLCLATHQPEKETTNSSQDDATSPWKQNECIWTGASLPHSRISIRFCLNCTTFFVQGEKRLVPWK